MNRQEILTQLAQILLELDGSKVFSKKEEEELSYKTIWNLKILLQNILLGKEDSLSRMREDQNSLQTHVPMGLTAVLGSGASGKSVFLRMAAQSVGVDLISMGEFGSNRAFGFTRMLGDTNDRPLIVVIDSLKDLWSTGIMNTGNAMPGGVTTIGAVFLSLINQILGFAGRAVVAAFNPLMIGSRNESSALALQEFLGSELSGLVVCKQGHIDTAYGKFLNDKNVPIRESLTIVDPDSFEAEYEKGRLGPLAPSAHMGSEQSLTGPLKDINVFGALLAGV